MGVRAPCSGDFQNRMNGVMTRWIRPGSSAPKPLRTIPGCSTVAVTPVPRSRRASS
jgi:hypothetical protein